MNLQSILILIIILQAILMIKSISSNKSNENWFYKFSYTKNVNSQIMIDCENSDQIWIGWSHYGTRNNLNSDTTESSSSSSLSLSINNKNSQQANPNQSSHNPAFPNEMDCWMNFTEKIAEQCNGADHCELSSQPTYIHKCGKISDYLYVTYKCIREKDTFDICTDRSVSFSQERMQNEQQSFYIKSSDFPNEYSSSLDCSCLITGAHPQSLKLDVLWFSLQDNDFLTLFNGRNVTGWINPTYEMPISGRNNVIRFMTDDALAYKGFWLKVSSRKACKDDWQLVGDQCVKVFSEPLDWRSANQKCQLMNGNLLKIEDVVGDLKLTQYMKSFYPEVNSYWIGLRKYLDQHNKEKWMWSNNSTAYSDVSWWPWRTRGSVSSSSTSSSVNTQYLEQQTKTPNNCVIKKRNEDGYFTMSCDPSIKNSFICQTNTVYPPIRPKTPDVKLQCGSTSRIQSQLYALEQQTQALSSSPATTSTLSQTKVDLIGANSIHNVIFPIPTFSVKPAVVEATKSSKKQTKTTSVTVQSNSHLINENANVLIKSNDYKINTTILAGIIAGIGLVIVLINLGVLFICRRNLKKFLKSSKDARPKEDMIQEYFEAFNTLHSNAKKGGLGGLTLKANIEQIVPSLQPQQVRTSSMSSGDDFLLNTNNSSNLESTQLFGYNNQHLSRDLTIRQSNVSSAFKPFLSRDHLLLQNSNGNANDLSMNQYDKMNHHNLLIFNQSVNNGNKMKNVLVNNDSADQYAHTYECLDTLELPNRRGTIVQLGLPNNNSRCNYRTVFNNNNSSNNKNDLLQQSTYEFANNNNELNGVCSTNFNNISTSSGSSSSGTSSTHQFITKSNSNLLVPENNKFIIQQLQANQAINLNDLNQLNQLNQVILQHKNNNNQNTIDQTVLCNLMTTGGDLIINGGSWSPDSAYYSSIPTLNNYNSFNIQHHQQQQQTFVNNNNFNHSKKQNLTSDDFKSHIV